MNVASPGAPPTYRILRLAGDAFAVTVSRADKDPAVATGFSSMEAAEQWIAADKVEAPPRKKWKLRR